MNVLLHTNVLLLQLIVDALIVISNEFCMNCSENLLIALILLKILMWGECCHQSVVTPLETDLKSVDDVFAKYASPNCSWKPFQGPFICQLAATVPYLIINLC